MLYKALLFFWWASRKKKYRERPINPSIWLPFNTTQQTHNCIRSHLSHTHFWHQHLTLSGLLHRSNTLGTSIFGEIRDSGQACISTVHLTRTSHPYTTFLRLSLSSIDNSGENQTTPVTTVLLRLNPIFTPSPVRRLSPVLRP
jgi:hypothetical protein